MILFRRILALAAGMLLALVLVAATRAQASPSSQGTTNEDCLACHGQPGLSMTLDDGETVPLQVDPSVFAQSVHGEQGFACVLCHTTVGGFPHREFTARDRRDLSLQLYSACKPCHASEYERTLDSVHQRAREAGNDQAAVCTDCHGAHDTRRLTDPQTGQVLAQVRTHIPETCARCHNAIYEKYLGSVHGSALVGEGNPDVPTCIDCHGVHNIPDPTTAAFRLESPSLCAGCHSDPARMDKYGLSTQVLNTYVADFHGTTVTLFEKQSPDAETNKPVCFDCHGVHDIKRVDDPKEGLQVRENLLARCQRCHPEATSNFPDAWLSHYIPSPTRAPLVYFVNLFYKLFIPGTLGGMAVLVGLDLSHRIRQRTHRRAEAPPPTLVPEPPVPAVLPGADALPGARGSHPKSTETVEEGKTEIGASLASDADQSPHPDSPEGSKAPDHG